MVRDFIKNMFKKNKPESSSSIMFDMALKCFEHECERAKRLEGKASIFIAMIGVMFTLVSAYFGLKLDTLTVYKRQISLCLFILIGICYSIGIISFGKVLNLQEYDYIDYKDYFTKKMLDAYTMSEMEELLMNKFAEFLVKIKGLNEDKADYCQIGIISSILGTILSFILMFIKFTN